MEETPLDRDSPVFIRTYVCHACGAEETVRPAVIRFDGEEIYGIYGSKADFCDNCGSVRHEGDEQKKDA